MPGALRLKGQGASPGSARGPAHVMAPEEGRAGEAHASGGDAARLADAVERAVEHLRALAGRSDLESAAILEFQIEMLRDPALLEPSLERIQRGAEAGMAWAATMDAYIASFEEAEDEHVRARGADMLDIRQQVLRALHGERPPDFPDGSILVGRDIAPSLFLSHDWSRGGGIVLFGGSVASHVATLARSRGVPMVVGVPKAAIETGMELVVDGDEGTVEDGSRAPSPASGADRAFAMPKSNGRPVVAPDERELCTVDGIRLTLQANIDHPSELRHLSPSETDGIGLFRTEYLMDCAADLADEDRQAEIYAEMLVWAGHRPVTIRLLDFGADKPPPGEHKDPTSFLGLRGIRLLLARPDVLRTQVRALLRAAPVGNLRVLLPMVTAPSELEQARVVFAQEAARLKDRGVPHAMPPLGLMVEVPAAALIPEAFDAAFFSFGTNDLAQYLSASARDNTAVSPLYAASHPALLRFLEMTVPEVVKTGKPVGICGDLAGDPAAFPALLSCGFREFSMAPRRMVLARAALSRLNADGSEARG